MKGENTSSVPFNFQYVPFLSALNRTRYTEIGLNPPGEMLVSSVVTGILPTSTIPSFIFPFSRSLLGYIALSLYLIIAFVTAALLEFLLLFWPTKKNTQRNHYLRLSLYILLLVFCIERVATMLIIINVTEPVASTISITVLSRVGSILFFAVMNLQCILWINVAQSTLEHESLANFLKVSCSLCFSIVFLSQVIAIAVSVVGVEQVFLDNDYKIVAYNLGLYNPPYGSLQLQIIELDNFYRESNRTCQVILASMGKHSQNFK